MKKMFFSSCSLFQASGTRNLGCANTNVKREGTGERKVGGLPFSASATFCQITRLYFRVSFFHIRVIRTMWIFLVVFLVIVLLSFPLIFQFGDNSGLHLIIFDEFDAVCKSRYMYNVRTWGIILIAFAVLVLRIIRHCCLWAVYRSNVSLCLLIFLVEWRNRRSRLSCQSTSG